MPTNKYVLDVKTKGAKKSEQQIKGVSSSLGGMASKMGLVAGAYFGGRALLSGISASIDAFGKQELAEKKLEQALGKTSTALLDQARALQQVSMYGDEDIIMMQSMLASFTDNEDEIKLLTEATLDLASGMGLDLKSAGDLVAKTIGSSTNAMSRYGISVEGAVGSTERLETLTGSVAKLFGGQAKAQSETMTGAIEQMKNAVGDTAEAFGSLLVPIILPLAKGLKFLAEGTQAVIEAFDFRNAELPELVSQLTDVDVKTNEFKNSLEGLSGAELIALAGVINDEVVPTLTVWNDESELVLNKQKALQDALAGNSDIIEANTGVIEESAIRGAIASDFGTNTVLGNIQKVKEGNLDLEANTIDWMTTKEFHHQKKMEMIDAEGEKLHQSGVSEVEAQAWVTKSKKMLWASEVSAKASQLSSMTGALSGLAKQHKQGALVGKRLAQAQALIDTYAGVNKAIAQGGIWGAVAGVSILATGLSNVAQIEATPLAEGMDGIVTKPTLFLAGEDGAESVSVTNLEKPSGGANAGGGGITLNISAPLVDESVIDYIIPAIERANRMSLA